MKKFFNNSLVKFGLFAGGVALLGAIMTNAIPVTLANYILIPGGIGAIMQGTPKKIQQWAIRKAMGKGPIVEFDDVTNSHKRTTDNDIGKATSNSNIETGKGKGKSTTTTRQSTK
ncbi:MAG: hypothetical protein ACTSXQ_05220 [Alphaproteobacteria bacterium]